MIERYAWASEPVAMAVTLLRGVDESAVIGAFGGDPDRARPDALGPLAENRHEDMYRDFVDVDVDRSDLLAEDRAHMWVTRVGEWLLITEDNGFRGVSDEVASALGADVHVCVMWNVNMVVRFLYAEGGRVIGAFSDFLQHAYGDDPGRLDPWAHGLPIDLGDERPNEPYVPRQQCALVMMERATGVPVEREYLARPQRHFTAPEDWRADMAWRSPPQQWVAQAAIAAPTEDDDGARARRLAILHAAAEAAPAAAYVPPAWERPPSDELPASLPVERLLGRSERAVVWLRSLSVYRVGAVVELDVLTRGVSSPSIELCGPWSLDSAGRVKDEVMRLGVLYADGRRASNVAVYSGQEEPTRPVLASIGSAATSSRTFWLWPLPPTGPLTFSCRWPALDIGHSEVVVDGAAIAAAAGRARPVWPASST